MDNENPNVLAKAVVSPSPSALHCEQCKANLAFVGPSALVCHAKFQPAARRSSPTHFWQTHKQMNNENPYVLAKAVVSPSPSALHREQVRAALAFVGPSALLWRAKFQPAVRCNSPQIDEQ